MNAAPPLFIFYEINNSKVLMKNPKSMLFIFH